MSQWRRVAVESLAWMADGIRRSVGVYNFWGNVNARLNVSFANDTPEVFGTRLRSVAAYIDWYCPLYAENPNMFTAFCYAFAEHVVFDEYYPELKALVHAPANDWLASYEAPPGVKRRPWARHSRH